MVVRTSGVANYRRGGKKGEAQRSNDNRESTEGPFGGEEDVAGMVDEPEWVGRG